MPHCETPEQASTSLCPSGAECVWHAAALSPSGKPQQHVDLLAEPMEAASTAACLPATDIC